MFWLVVLLLVFLIGLSYFVFGFSVCPYCHGVSRPSWTLDKGNCIYCGAWWIGESSEEIEPELKKRLDSFDEIV